MTSTLVRASILKARERNSATQHDMEVSIPEQNKTRFCIHTGILHILAYSGRCQKFLPPFFVIYTVNISFRSTYSLITSSLRKLFAYISDRLLVGPVFSTTEKQHKHTTYSQSWCAQSLFDFGCCSQITFSKADLSKLVFETSCECWL